MKETRLAKVNSFTMKADWWETTNLGFLKDKGRLIVETKQWIDKPDTETKARWEANNWKNLYGINNVNWKCD
jgi:hypothetical protein